MGKRMVITPPMSLIETDFKHRGGIRGIVELEILRAIERFMGDKIPIQSFFDLIVGTR